MGILYLFVIFVLSSHYLFITEIGFSRNVGNLDLGKIKIEALLFLVICKI